MKHYLITIIFLTSFSASIVNGQNAFLNEILNVPYFPKSEQYITEIAEGSCGRIYSTNYGYGNVQPHHGIFARDNYPEICQHSSNGNIVNQYTYGNTGNFDYFSKILVASDGNVYSASRNVLHWSSQGISNTLTGSFIIKKHNPDNLSQIWSKEYTVVGQLSQNNQISTEVYREGMAFDLIESFDANHNSDGFVACGITTIYYPGNTEYEYEEMAGPIIVGEDDNDGIADGLYLNPSIVKFNSNGDIIWGHRLNISYMNTQIGFKVVEKIVQTVDGGYIIAGIGSPLLGIKNSHLYVVKVDLNGNLVWINQVNISLNSNQINEMKLVGSKLIILTDNNEIIQFNVLSSGISTSISKKIANLNGYQLQINDFTTDGINFTFIGVINIYNSTFPFVLKTDNNFNYAIGNNSSNVINLDFNPRTIIKSELDGYYFIGGETTIANGGPNNVDHLILLKL